MERIKLNIQSLSEHERVKKYYAVLNSIKDGSFPPEPISWSAIYHNFSIAGLDTNEMRHAINASDVLATEIQIIINKLKWN